MKLLRLKITDPEGFRSLQPGFEHFFRTEWDLQEEDEFAPFVCAGRNGSGKSNLLEVLAAIFFHLDCKSLNYRPELFEYDADNVPYGYQEERSFPDAFELEYLSKPFAEFVPNGTIDLPHIKVVKEDYEGPQFFILNDSQLDKDTPLDGLMVKTVLPDFVVAYSSGENEILSLPFFKMRFIHFDEYLDSLRNDTGYTLPEGRLVFLDQAFNQAILLSNFILGAREHLQLFSDVMEVQGIVYFRIILKEILFPYVPEDSEASSEQWSLLGNVRDIHRKLQQCASASFFDESTKTYYLDYWLDDECRKAFELQFGTALELLRSLQLLLTLNLYSVSNEQKQRLYQSQSLYVNEVIPVLPDDQRVMRFTDVVLKKTGVDAVVYSKALSDGENQFLHTLGLCALYSNSDVLFLLDEPDTHFNPDWRSQLISRLKACFPEASQHEMLITTHTPFLISDSKTEKVMVFSKKDNVVSIEHPNYNTLGASINKITLHTFGKRETIGGFAQQQMQALKSRFEQRNPSLTTEEKQALIDEINQRLGDSVEKVLLIKTILDSMDNQG